MSNMQQTVRKTRFPEQALRVLLLFGGILSQSTAGAGDPPTRPICQQWNVVGTPALFIVDHKGVIRHKWLGSEKVMDAALQRVLKEAERDAQSGQ
jgi:hypothetical protein